MDALILFGRLNAIHGKAIRQKHNKITTWGRAIPPSTLDTHAHTQDKAPFNTWHQPGNNLTKCPIRDGVAHRISIMCRRDLDHPPISDPTVIQAGTIPWTQAPRSQLRLLNPGSFARRAVQ